MSPFLQVGPNDEILAQGLVVPQHQLSLGLHLARIPVGRLSEVVAVERCRQHRMGMGQPLLEKPKGNGVKAVLLEQVVRGRMFEAVSIGEVVIGKSVKRG